MLSDLLVSKQIREGNIKAFESVFRLYYHPLCLYAASITGRREIAEEIVQELFYLCWKERESLHLFCSLKSYLYKAARNRSLQYLEHQAVCHRHEENVHASPSPSRSPSPEEELEYKELKKIVAQALRRLPERRRQIFRMHRTEGMKYAEIAARLGLSVKTIEAEMTKALQMLRKEIEQYT